MYYRDQHGNPTHYVSDENHHYYSNSINAGGLSREDFSFNDVTSWFDKYKMWFFYAIVIVLLMMLVKWWMSSRKIRGGPASVFY